MDTDKWLALGRSQFPGDPSAFTTLASYWRDAVTGFSAVKNPSTDAIGVAA